MLGVTSRLSPVTCHLSLTSTATATDPPPDESPLCPVGWFTKAENLKYFSKDKKSLRPKTTNSRNSSSDDDENGVLNEAIPVDTNESNVSDKHFNRRVWVVRGVFVLSGIFVIGKELLLSYDLVSRFS